MGQALFDGTFSTEAVAAAGHAVVDRLHDEAMATIAALAENWDAPVEDTPAVEGDAPVAFENPATWSVEDEDDDEIRVLQAFELPALLARPRCRPTTRPARSTPSTPTSSPSRRGRRATGGSSPPDGTPSEGRG